MQIKGISFSYIPRPINSVMSPVFIGGKYDSFEKQSKTSLQLGIEKYHKEISDNLEIKNKNDIEEIAKSLNKEFPERTIDEIYYAMGVLSEYSSIKSWSKLKNKVKAVGKIEQSINWGTNKRPVYLNEVFAYLNKKNTPNVFLEKDSNIYNVNKKSVFLDSNLINRLKTDTKLCNLIKRSNYTTIYIENFEKSYNFLNQEKEFQEFVSDTLKKIPKDGDFKHNLYNYLNAKQLENIKRLGLRPVILEQNSEYTPDGIAYQLNPIILNISDMEKTFEKELVSSPMYDREYILRFFKEMSVFISPHKLAKDIKNLHQNILKNIDTSRPVLYNIPKTSKSFALINYMYQKINNIPHEQFIYTDFETHLPYSNIIDIPKNAQIIVIDDCIMTGESLLDQEMNYIEYVKQHKIPQIIFAPLYCTKFGRHRIQDIKRPDDKIIVGKIIPSWVGEMPYDLSASSVESFGGSNYVTTSFVLPYMGPDTNILEFRGIYEKMLFCPSAQKEI